MPNPTVPAAATGLPDPKIRDAASLDFEPWEHTPDEWVPPTNAEWAKLANPHLVTVRMAWVMLHKTKPEMMTIVDTMDEETGRQMMDGFVGTINFFTGMLAIMESAEARIHCAGAAVIESEKQAKPKRKPAVRKRARRR